MKKQTTVYVCDRCGKEYDDIQQVRDFSFTSFDKMVNESKHVESVGRLTYDLCDDCLTAFKYWWNNGDGDVWFEDAPHDEKPSPEDAPVIPVPSGSPSRDAIAVGEALAMSVKSFIREQENKERKLKAWDEMTMQEKHEDVFGY